MALSKSQLEKIPATEKLFFPLPRHDEEDDVGKAPYSSRHYQYAADRVWFAATSSSAT